MSKMICTCRRTSSRGKTSAIDLDELGYIGTPGRKRTRKKSSPHSSACRIIDTSRGKRKLCRTPQGYRFQAMDAGEVSGLGRTRKTTRRKSKTGRRRKKSY